MTKIVPFFLALCSLSLFAKDPILITCEGKDNKEIKVNYTLPRGDRLSYLKFNLFGKEYAGHENKIIASETIFGTILSLPAGNSGDGKNYSTFLLPAISIDEPVTFESQIFTSTVKAPSEKPAVHQINDSYKVRCEIVFYPNN